MWRKVARAPSARVSASAPAYTLCLEPSKIIAYNRQYDVAIDLSSKLLRSKLIIIIIINQGTNARRCPMPFSLFDAIFVSPKKGG